MYGKWIGYEPKNGRYLYIGSWKDNQKVGKWMNYSERGQLESVITYGKNGELNGTSILYNESGRPISEGKFKVGKRAGRWKYYYDFGGLWRDCTYQNGELNGPSKIYTENGILEEDANYKNNRYHGECTMYDKKSGKLVQRGIYENGKMVKFLEGTPTRK
jgi:antitoxin component YwqK of YwqJK toxin-antitoxin module